MKTISTETLRKRLDSGQAAVFDVRGDVDFEEIIRALNVINYRGPLSVEWEDCGMDREFGAEEACQFTRQIDFSPSAVAFDAAFDKG